MDGEPTPAEPMTDTLVPATLATGASKLAANVELSVIILTFNEKFNVAVLVERLSAALAGIGWVLRQG
jgi:hypothetical protein